METVRPRPQRRRSCAGGRPSARQKVSRVSADGLRTVTCSSTAWVPTDTSCDSETTFVVTGVEPPDADVGAVSTTVAILRRATKP